MDYIVPHGISYDAWNEWSPLARGFALAWMRNRAETCSGCGTRDDEWANEDEDAYVPASTTCRGCAQLGAQRSNLAKDHEGNPLPGQRVYLEPMEAFRARMNAKHHPPLSAD